MSRQFGARASLRADLLIRHYVDFYMRQTDTTTGHVQDPTGRRSISRSSRTRRMACCRATMRAARSPARTASGRTLDVGANYTLSRA